MKPKIPKHIALVMDGNGRWAKEKGLARVKGHSQAEFAIMETIQACVEIGVKELSLFAFSTENWLRPKDEVSFLMNYSRDVISRRIDELDEWGVEIKWVGRVPKMWKSVLKVLENAEKKTKTNQVMRLNFCINYGGQAEIIDATNRIIDATKRGEINHKINKKSFEKYLYSKDMLPVDLFIRTSGERRLSNFLLWQSAYAEIIWKDILFPDFGRDDLFECINEFQKRNRRFGKV